MSRLSAHSERHLIQRIGWLRAAIVKANDGILSTAALVVGVAGLVVGAMSMAAGEHVSVSLQSDTERADQDPPGLIGLVAAEHTGRRPLAVRLQLPTIAEGVGGAGFANRLRP